MYCSYCTHIMHIQEPHEHCALKLASEVDPMTLKEAREMIVGATAAIASLATRLRPLTQASLFTRAVHESTDTARRMRMASQMSNVSRHILIFFWRIAE